WCEFPAEEWLVLTPPEQLQIVPAASVSVGTSWDIADPLTTRLLTRIYPQTENNDLATNGIERQSLRATVLSVRDGIARARIDGTLRMKHNFYPDREDGRMVDATVIGFVDFDVNTRRIRSLRLVTDQA